MTRSRNLVVKQHSSCHLLSHHMQITAKHHNGVAPQQFGERFKKLQQVTEARDPKQQAALVRSLRMFPVILLLLPDTVQAKATALKQQLLQQLGVGPEQTQQLISRHPIVLGLKADLVVQKATEQGQLLSLEAAEVVQWWTRTGRLPRLSTQLLHAKLAQLQLLLQPYMPSADVRQMVLSQPNLLSSHSPEAVQGRLEVLQECLPDWTPQQLGAQLLTYVSVLTRSPETIRHKWRIVSKYRDMCMLGAQKQQEQQQQQGQQHQAMGLSLFRWSAERYALLEYIMMQQLQHQEQQQSTVIVNSTATGSSVSNSSQGMKSSSNDGAHSSHIPPMLTVLHSRKRTFERLLQEHYPGFQQWYKQRQQAVKGQGQQAE
jgi:hypothetical protein